jgi:hypothetical protein
MKYVFKIKTVPTLQATEIITVVVTSSVALAMLTVSLNNPSIAIYSITDFALVTWIALMKTKL